MLHVTHDGPYSPGGFELTIEHDVTVGHRCVLHGCRIGAFSLIGIGTIVMDGVRVGEYTMLGAGSLVPPGKVLDGGYLWVGRPVRRVRALTERERANVAYLAAHYVDNKNRHGTGG